MSDCGVCLNAGHGFGDNGFQMWTATFKTKMACCECGRSLPSGEPHEKARYRVEDRWYTHHTCPVCAEIAWSFFCSARLYGSLWNYVNDDLFPKFSKACLNKLKTPQAKAELQHRWIEWKGLQDAK